MLALLSCGTSCTPVMGTYMETYISIPTSEFNSRRPASTPCQLHSSRAPPSLKQRCWWCLLCRLKASRNAASALARRDKNTLLQVIAGWVLKLLAGQGNSSISPAGVHGAMGVLVLELLQCLAIQNREVHEACKN